ncbi:hypothetical protein [Jiangella sp. DSM 45060]|uniref:hypothetical protein n=1 Tax=Jiangella sp. DSM 45060 TaxID=1798224 RepID=UPI00155F8E59|nr:hypothetical protein [Jiangella sp. DSM 45060]
MPDDQLMREVRRLATEREALTRKRAEVTEQLRAATVRLVQAGEISESQAAALAGVNRNTLRTWLGKQDWL